MKAAHFLFSLVSLFFVVGADSVASPRKDQSRKTRFPEALCKEFRQSVFKPCVCSKDVPKTVQYRPALEACGGKAAAILLDDVASAYSVVLRDKQNRDRFPPQGYNGCTQDEVEKGLAQCSAFKCQKIIKSKGKQICCFGDSGNSNVLKGATRLTIKLKDIPGSNKDPLVRICLNGFSPRRSLN